MSWKAAVWRLLGKDSEAVVVSFLSGPEPLARSLLAEVRALVPDREHFAVTELEIEGVTCIRPSELPGPLRHKRIGLAPTLFASVRLAFRYAPLKVLAYNERLERHHLHPSSPVASLLFLRGVPLDRIWLRPRWLFPYRRERSVFPSEHHVLDGRPLREGKPRIAVLSPYFPYPLSHGGAVRIFNLLREANRDYDIFLFAFVEKPSNAEGTPLLDFCSKVVVFPNPRYREPRWASVLPPEVKEFYSPYVASVLAKFRREFDIALLQVEYTQLATYGGDVLVEHDVTFDLHQQVYKTNPSRAARWDLSRWLRFERRAVERYRRVVVMSEKDAELLGKGPQVRVIPNGVDLKRFHVAAETPGRRLLFVGSFRHFPNVVAFRWFLEKVWPNVRGARFVTIAGPNPDQYLQPMPADPNVEVHGFISDVRPFYQSANVVVVPTQVSAGTNLKALEALACERAMVSTTSGCAGLGLQHGHDVWIADDPAEFARAIEVLLGSDELRHRIAAAGRTHVAKQFDWSRIGRLQSRMWSELLTGIVVRPGRLDDVESIRRIQKEADTASQWEPSTYFEFEVRVAERSGAVCGFLVSRDVAGELEVLNLATDAASRRQGIATALLHSLDAEDIFLEVRVSNVVARKLYEKLGFVAVGTRSEYYDNPVETAVVMRLSRAARS
jgi:glycosyltransferase involved in cell wall biosynthesis/GNAT superfamily N-acetyltransferase